MIYWKRIVTDQSYEASCQDINFAVAGYHTVVYNAFSPVCFLAHLSTKCV